MFELFVAGRSEKRTKSKTLAYAASALANAGLVTGLLVWSAWQIEKVQGKMVPITFAVSAAPPAPPPEPSIPKPHVVRPASDGPRIAHPASAPQADAPVAHGPERPGADEPPTPPGPPADDGPPGPATADDDGGPPSPPVTVPIEGVEAQRTAGTREIGLPLAVKQALVAQHKTQVTVGVRFCLDTRGVPNRVQMVGTTGFPEADEKIAAEVRAWRYRPYMVNGTPIAACTAVRFQYQIER